MPVKINERKTEAFVRKHLKNLGYYDDSNIVIEEQKSDNPKIDKLLKNASKKGTGSGNPEFIIYHKVKNDLIIVIECKADIKKHESSDHNKYSEYAVDGALLYASYLSKEFSVIAIAVSGQSEKEIKIDTYLYLLGEKTYTVLTDKLSMPIKEMLSWEKFVFYVTYDKTTIKTRSSDLLHYSRELHNYMRDYCKITETEKPLLVSGILLAQMDSAFNTNYMSYEKEVALPRELFSAICRVIDGVELGINQTRKKEAIINIYRFISDHPELSKFNNKTNETPLFHVVSDLIKHVKPFIEDYYDFDVIGRFYGEFIRYTGGDKKGLGIVLTPKHITELFSDIAKITKNSIVLDICAGTAGFLISAMKKMLDQATNEEEKKRIKNQALIGVEQEPKMFALAVSNMILRGDGKANLYQGSCFESDIIDKYKNKADAGFINPPYAQKGEGLDEWNFIQTLLEALKQGGTGIAIVPMSLAITYHPIREEVLSLHRLEAVMSMPIDLFYPIPSSPTCIMVFTAYVPHKSDPYHKTWFGYWRDDGFKKDRVEGRIPTDAWESIRNKWLETYTIRENIPGFSISKKVDINDEWCAEAYLETNYFDIRDDDFKQVLKNYIVFKMQNEILQELLQYKIEDLSFKSISSNKVSLNVEDWKWFPYTKIFDLFSESFISISDAELIPGKYPFISTGSANNGVACFTDISEAKTYPAGCITVASSGNAGETFYQPVDFKVTNMVIILKPKFIFNIYIGLFLATLIYKEKYKYSYGRKAGLERLRDSCLKLPIDNNGNPDWSYMENFIKSLPYSCAL